MMFLDIVVGIFIRPPVFSLGLPAASAAVSYDECPDAWLGAGHTSEEMENKSVVRISGRKVFYININCVRINFPNDLIYKKKN